MQHHGLVKFQHIITAGTTTASHKLMRATLRTPSLADLYTIRCVMEELEDVARRNPRVELIVDFHRVGHASVEILNELIWLKNGLERCGGALHLSGVGENMLELMRLTDLEAEFEVDQRPHSVVHGEHALDT